MIRLRGVDLEEESRSRDTIYMIRLKTVTFGWGPMSIREAASLLVAAKSIHPNDDTSM